MNQKCRHCGKELVRACEMKECSDPCACYALTATAFEEPKRQLTQSPKKIVTKKKTPVKKAKKKVKKK